MGHAFNPNASLLSTLNLILAGISLAVGFLVTGRLALPIGLHITWNFFQGSVFGFAVSGADSMNMAQIFRIQQGGPDLWTGAAFGPEGGLLGRFAVIFEASAVLLWCKLRYGRLAIHPSIYTGPTNTQAEHRLMDRTPHLKVVESTPT